jgi:DNA-directed RNA polymerase subunit RPC12/RpoP
LTRQKGYDIILIESEAIIMNEPFPYITCPDCESQLLNPTIEDSMYHFVCHECGSGVWLEIEESEEE